MLGPPSPAESALVRFGHFVARVIFFLGGGRSAVPPKDRNMLFKKCAFGGYDFTLRSPRLLDQTLPFLFYLTQEKSR